MMCCSLYEPMREWKLNFYIDIGAAVLLRILNSRPIDPLYRRMFLKIFKALVRAYEKYSEFLDAASVMRH